jgi:23S rRNA (uracil1939-C5)-methyltransferase
MAKTPTEVELNVTTLSEDGLGGAMLNERPIWIRNALPGEKVIARILKRRGGKKFADGRLVDSLTQDQLPSPDRVDSTCEYFPRCGGCAMHHISASAQLGHKQSNLFEELTRVGVNPEKWRAASSLTRSGYRRKARMGVRVVGENVLVGFRESFSNRVARIDRCMTLTKELSALLPDLKKVIAQMSEPRSIPQLEVAQGDRSIAILVRHLQSLTRQDRLLWQSFEINHCVQVLLQSKGYDSLVRLREGDDVIPLDYKIPEYGLSLQFYPHQFTQVNALMNRELVRTALGYLGDIEGEIIADMFCGIGNFTLPLARAGAKVIGIEGSQEVVQMGWRNAKRNGLMHRCYFSDEDLYSDTASAVSDLSMRSTLAHFGDFPRAMLLDPPRSGAGPNLESWIAPQLKKIVYVSCNPKTFAHDAKRLNEFGFILKEVGIYDMFPNTSHVETIGYFIKD